jgi:hypothetical protein
MSTAADFTTAAQPELAPWAEEALKQQEAAPQVQAEQAKQDPAANDVILFQLPALAAGDAQGLADLIVSHPDLYEQILEAAANFLGNETVTRALDIVHGGKTAPAEAAKEPAAEVTPPQVVAQQAEEQKCGVCQADVCACEAPAAEVEPGWVVRARAFNAKHEDDVNLFNMATGFVCTVNGQLDPNAVASWQAKNGVDPDGRVGRTTADRAWALMAVEQPKQQYTLPDDIPPPQ